MTQLLCLAGLPKQSGMEESAEDDSCFVCQEADVGDVLLICESCERAAHKHCVGLRRIPKVRDTPVRRVSHGQYTLKVIKSSVKLFNLSLTEALYSRPQDTG